MWLRVQVTYHHGSHQGDRHCFQRRAVRLRLFAMDTLAGKVSSWLDSPGGDLEPELKTNNRTTLCLTNVQAAASPMDGEVTSQLISSDSADMATEVESDLSLSGHEVPIAEEVHALHIRVCKQAILEEIISNIGTAHWQGHKDRS